LAIRSADRKVSFNGANGVSRILFERDRGGAFVAWTLLLLLLGIFGGYLTLIYGFIGILLISMSLAGALWAYSRATVVQGVTITPRSIMTRSMVSFPIADRDSVAINNARREVVVERDVNASDEGPVEETPVVTKTGPDSWIVTLIRVLTLRTVYDSTRVEETVEARAWFVFIRGRGRDVKLFTDLYREEAELLARLIKSA
jgi:hypothetical protein